MSFDIVQVACKPLNAFTTFRSEDDSYLDISIYRPFLLFPGYIEPLTTPTITAVMCSNCIYKGTIVKYDLLGLRQKLYLRMMILVVVG